jgi:hypothetical protein
MRLDIVYTATEKMRLIAISLPIRILISCVGLAMLIFLSPVIFANMINPRVWYDTLIAVYFLLAGLFACIYFFSRNIVHLLIFIPAAIYLLISLIWFKL